MADLNPTVIGDCTLYCGDCLVEMAGIADASVDMILCDMPYGTTACKWDTVIPFEPLWANYKRIIKPRGAIVLTASQPFTTTLICSNREWFKYCLVWNKKFCGNFNLAKHRPMIVHEDVVVFCAGKPQYNPQMVLRETPIRGGGLTHTDIVPQKKLVALKKEYTHKFPISILDYPRQLGTTVHPTQKPVALMEYLIRTYTNEGETVLDNTMGSGTTGVACVNTGRKFIGIERDATYFGVCVERITKAYAQVGTLLKAS